MQTATKSNGGLMAQLGKLHEVKIGGVSNNPQKTKVKLRDLRYILSNMATLIENGVSLPKSLFTVAREPSMKKYAHMLESLRKRVEAGESFSQSIGEYPATFSEVMINQVRVGERSGTMAKTLRTLADQLEQSNELKRKILKRLSYPLIVLGAGSGVVAFMLLYIVPTFEETYEKAKIPLPTITQLLINVGWFATSYGWMVLLGMVAAAFIFFRLRKIESTAMAMDRFLLKLPMIGPWCRDVAVLQLMDVMGVMMQSGFKVVEALSVSSGSISNRAIRASVDELRHAVLRGDKLSREIEKQEDLFPPIVSQLVIVGEQTGNLAKATGYVREHMRKDIERKADIAIGAIEPILTLGMALAVCGILLAIYMPMFGMVDAVGAG